jgi:hypothetical protein
MVAVVTEISDDAAKKRDTVNKAREKGMGRPEIGSLHFL